MKDKSDCCGNCLFGKDSGTARHDIKIVACRRYPPQQGDRQDRPGLYPFPMLNETEWCGEHIRKTKSEQENG